MARAASAAGGIDEELEDILVEDSNNSKAEAERKDEDCMSRGKKKLSVFLKKHAFITVLCMASVSTK